MIVWGFTAREAGVPVAELAGLVRMIYAWERGDHKLTERYELLYAAALSVDPDRLSAGPQYDPGTADEEDVDRREFGLAAMGLLAGNRSRQMPTRTAPRARGGDAGAAGGRAARFRRRGRRVSRARSGQARSTSCQDLAIPGGRRPERLRPTGIDPARYPNRRSTPRPRRHSGRSRPIQSGA